jgi:hypothetical protein
MVGINKWSVFVHLSVDGYVGFFQVPYIYIYIHTCMCVCVCIHEGRAERVYWWVDYNILEKEQSCG